jgi:plasmid stabilization system protein ParE
VVECRAAARSDLLRSIDYIAEDNPDAAQRLKDDIEARVGRLPEHPKLYRAGRIVGTREMVVRAHCVAIYAEDARSVSILRELHVARHWPPG